MYSNAQQATRAYQSFAAEQAVDTADGYALIQQLMMRLIARMAMAKHCIKMKDVAKKGEHLSRAVEIVSVLQVAVDEQHNEELAGNLLALYDYAARRLLHANLHSDVGAIDEVDGLIREVKEAWDSIGEQLPGSDA